MKRLGRGSIYYGSRPEISEAEYTAMEQKAEEDDGYLKPDPVLITGATGRTGQWIALGLMNQGFNVRCYTRDFSNAESMFGPSGSNLDVFPGSITSYEDVKDAVEDSIAIVCASGAPWWLPTGYGNVDVKGVQNLVKAAKEAGTVRRFVLISSTKESDARGKAKREAEKAVMESGIPYVIIRSPKLKDTEGGLSKIFLTGEGEKKPERGLGHISRVDLAQVTCQALVYGRSVERLNEADPDADFEFPSCIVNTENGADPYVPDKRFWKTEFNRISDLMLNDQSFDGQQVVEGISGE